MKISIVYETADIIRLIRQDLQRKNLKADDDDIKFDKKVWRVAIETTDDSVDDVPPPVTAAAITTAAPLPASALTVIEGGNNDVDMAGVLQASQRVAQTNPGKFPKPERTLMDGESYDPPTGDRR